MRRKGESPGHHDCCIVLVWLYNSGFYFSTFATDYLSVIFCICTVFSFFLGLKVGDDLLPAGSADFGAHLSGHCLLTHGDLQQPFPSLFVCATKGNTTNAFKVRLYKSASLSSFVQFIASRLQSHTKAQSI